MDPYMELLVDELDRFNGTLFYDGFQKETFKMKIIMALHVLDYPGQSKMFQSQG